MRTWRKDAIGMAVLALIVWAAFVIVWSEYAWSTVHHLDRTDLRGSHRTKQNLLLAAVAVFGVPPLGAVLGWVWGPISNASRRPSWCTAAGFLAGALSLTVIGAIGFVLALYRAMHSWTF
ncbi:hypothetical protein [Actinomadura sp. NTSP31]|uniref:hypothetical protein n=1 Tax=Actinomadura sp. NTSP31 TaxID=1735447 RepID=UPI0035C25AEF